MAGSGHGTRKGWDVPSERPELNSEVQRNLNAKNNLRNEQDENQLNNDYPDLNVRDICRSFSRSCGECGVLQNTHGAKIIRNSEERNVVVKKKERK